MANSGNVFMYDPVTLNEVASWSGIANGLSVAGSDDGRIFVGGFLELFVIDPADDSVTSIAHGAIPGFVYGVSIAEDLIYASGSNMPHVQIVDLDGVPAGTVPVISGSNSRATTFGPSGAFYLASFDTHAVEWWSNGFIHEGTFSGGSLGTPFGMATRSNGTLLVASQNNAIYYTYTPGGNWQSSHGIDCTGQVRNIAVDGADTLYIACFSSNRVAVFDASNSEIGSIAVAAPSGVGMLRHWPAAKPEPSP